MATPKLKDETEITISHNDLAAILTEHFCSSSYDAFAKLKVEYVSLDAADATFTITLTAKPEPDPVCAK